MLPAVAAASPTPHTSPSISSRLRRHHLGLSFQTRLLRASARASSPGAGRARLLLAGAFASSDGGAGQDVGSSASTTGSGSAYIGLFVRMLGLDNDPRDREHAVCTLWQYSLGGRKSMDEIMQFPGCIVLIISLLKSESTRTCEAAAGLLRNVTSVQLYRKMAVESGAMEEIFSLLCKSTVTPETIEQCLCTIWNFSIDGNWRYKILRSDVLTKIVNYLDDEDIKVKEAAGGIISNLALSASNHGPLVEAGVILKLVRLLQTKEDDYKIIRKEARSSLIQLASDDYYHSLIIEEGLVRVPLVGSAAYKAFRPLPHSWPSFPDGSEIQRSSRPSKYGATELLLGLSVNEKETKPDEAKIKAMIGRSNQQFLARVGAIELDDEGKDQSGSEKNDLYTILPWVDGVARLVLILGLEGVSAIKKAATAIGDASINEHMCTSFKEAGAVKPLLQLLKHSDITVREAAAYALEKLSVSSTICQKIKAEGGLELLVNAVKDPNNSIEQLEKIIYTLSRIFDRGTTMVDSLDSYDRTGSEDVTNSERSIQGDIETGNNRSSHTSVNQEMASEMIIDFDAISRLTKVMKEGSPSLQAKVCSVLEHLVASEQHATAMTAAFTGSVIEAILEIGVIHGTRGDPENLDDLSIVVTEEVRQAVSAAVRLLTRLLDFDLFVRSINSEKFTSLLRRMLKSNFPLQSKDWFAACLIKLESRAGLSGDHGVSSIDMEITIYEIIPRLVDQMMTSFSFENKRSAVIELNRIISGVTEYIRAVAAAGGIFPLVKMLEEGDEDALEACLAILYNLSMDPENHPAIIAAGAVPLLKRIALAEGPHWTSALQLLRTLPV
uniref:U-box domain-containing protein n=1 Tax=Arundo donax TaxID=35708 RepID=A0A0A9DGZ4_ARUDO